jgi:flagellar biosynthesis protein FlhF
VLFRLKVGSKKVTTENETNSRPAEQPRTPDTVLTEPLRGDRSKAASHEPPKPGGPRIKTYVAASVSQAMLMARRELGEEAILIQTTPRQKADNPNGQYEVTFGIIPGVPPPAEPAKTPAQELRGRGEPGRGSDCDTADSSRVAKALGSLQREVAAIHSLLLRSTLGTGSASLAINHLPDIYAMLVHHGVDPDLAADLVREVQGRIDQGARPTGPQDIAPANGDSTLMLAEHLRSRVRTDDTLSSGASKGKAVLLIGPPAVGKTTTLIKLAIEFGLKRGKRVEILSVDRFKPEGNHALESMARMLNVPYQASPSVTALAVALSRPRPEGTLVLVDTSGYGSGSVDDQTELAAFTASGHETDVHLVLPATWHSASVRQAVDRFEIFQPARLLFTMLDQTAVYGSMLQEAWRTGKPLSFIANGPLGSGSVMAARLEEILRLMWDSAGALPPIRDERCC